MTCNVRRMLATRSKMPACCLIIGRFDTAPNCLMSESCGAAYWTRKTADEIRRFQAYIDGMVERSWKDPRPQRERRRKWKNKRFGSIDEMHDYALAAEGMAGRKIPRLSMWSGNRESAYRNGETIRLSSNTQRSMRQTLALTTGLARGSAPTASAAL